MSATYLHPYNYNKYLPREIKDELHNVFKFQGRSRYKKFEPLNMCECGNSTRQKSKVCVVCNFKSKWRDVPCKHIRKLIST